MTELLNYIPKKQHTAFLIWYENKGKIGHVRLHRLTGISPNTLKKWIKKWKKLIKSSLPFDSLIKHIKIEIPKYKIPKQTKYHHKYITLLIGDCHIWEVISPQETHNLSDYNMTIFEQRLHNYFSYINNNLIDNNTLAVNIDFLGDITNGIIHQELLKTNEPMMDNILYAVKLMTQHIVALSSKVPHIHIHAVYGNHARLTQKKEYKRAYDNFDYLFYKLLNYSLSNIPNINISISKTFFLTYKNPLPTVIYHGDNIRFYHNIPFYGIIRFIEKFSTLHNMTIFEQGHIHYPNYLIYNNKHIFINGAFTGTNEFSIHKIFGITKPYQIAYTISHNKINSCHIIPL